MTHPGPGVRDRPSIASLVSSFDPTFSRYAAFTRVQTPRVEVIEELDEMFFVSTSTVSKRCIYSPTRIDRIALFPSCKQCSSPEDCLLS